MKSIVLSAVLFLLPTLSNAYELRKTDLQKPRSCAIIKSKWITHDSSQNQMAPGGKVLEIGFGHSGDPDKLILDLLIQGERIRFLDGKGRSFTDWLYIGGTRFKNGDTINGNYRSYLFKFHENRNYPYLLYFTPMDSKGKVIRVHYILGEGSDTDPQTMSYVTFDCKESKH